jgi:hypothetical protein
MEPDRISTLLQDFIRQELDVVLLFLQSVARIEIWEIAKDSTFIPLAGAQLARDSPVLLPIRGDGVMHSSLKYTVTVSEPSKRESHSSWRIIDSTFPDACLNSTFNASAVTSLRQHKLRPEVKLAIPLPHADQQRLSGRLFTYLPLPLKTGFPCHIHSLFALTQSRQNLKNSSEVGVVEGSDDR